VEEVHELLDVLIKMNTRDQKCLSVSDLRAMNQSAPPLAIETTNLAVKSSVETISAYVKRSASMNLMVH